MSKCIKALFLICISTNAFAFLVSDCVVYSEKNNDRCEAVKNCTNSRILELDKKLTLLDVSGSDVSNNPEKIEVALQKAQAYMYEETTIYKGVLEINNAYDMIKKMPENEETAAIKKELLRTKGIYEFRLGELKNCVENHNSDSCIFPLSQNAMHKDKYGSTAAIKTFMEYLQIYGPDESIVWLLNIAHQTLGTYPEGVPAEYLLQPSLFKSSGYIARFRDVAGLLGLQAYSQEAGGVAVDDFNGDGYLDIMFSSLGFCDPVIYFESDGNGSYIDKTLDSGVDQVKNSIGIISADYDNDGDLDLYMSSGGWENDSYLINLPINFNELYQNNGDGKFKDVTNEVGLRTGRNFTLASIWGDYNNDGWVDLFVCNELSSPELFKNDKGHFIKTLGMGVVGQNDKRCKSAAWGDVNNDGWLDLFLSYSPSYNEFYLNDKGKGFIRMDLGVDISQPQFSFGTWFFDYDNDGWQDLFVASFDAYSQGVQYAQQLNGKHVNGETMKLFHNLGYGIFWDVTGLMGLDMYLPTMGINFGDVNNDGFLDIYMGTGGVAFDQIEPNRLFLNINGKRFVDATISAGVGNLQKGHGIAFADVDNDGDQDIAAQFGGGFPGDKFFPALYQNPGNTNRWITLRLEGVNANRSAIGAKIKILVKTYEGLKEIYRVVDHGSTFGANPLQAQIGLGNAFSIESISITWRGDLQPEVYNDINMNKIVYIKEGNVTPRYLDLNILNFENTDATDHVHHHSP